MNKVSSIAARSNTLIDLLRLRSEEHPNRLAYIFLNNNESQNNSTLTFGELFQRAQAIASRLQSLEMEGERAMLFYPSCMEYLEAFWGCILAGVIAVPLYPPRPNRSFDRFLNVVRNADARVALTTTNVIKEYKSRFDHESHVAKMTWIASDDVSTCECTHWQPPSISRESIAYLQYTSGSTSTPRGVIVSHENLLVHNQLMKELLGHPEGSTMGAWLPLHHDMGLVGFGIQGPYIGGPVYWQTPFDFLKKPIRWLKMLSDHQVYTTAAPNFAYEICAAKTTLEQREGLDLSHLKIAYNGSEHIRASTCERFICEFEPYGFDPKSLVGAYGMAEFSLMATCGHIEKMQSFVVVNREALDFSEVQVASENSMKSVKLMSSGRIADEVNLRIVDPWALTVLPSNRIGEIWLSHGSVAKGYWDDGQATQDTFHAYIADTGEGPYLRTGDLGFVFENELYVTGRLKEVIIIEGRNHYPQDIEQTVEQIHPAIRTTGCAAFSITENDEEKLVVLAELDHRWKQVDTYSSPFQNEHLSERVIHLPTLRKEIRKAISEVHDVRLHKIVFLKFGQVLKTTSGKTQRTACRNAYLSGLLETVEELSNLNVG